MNDVIKVRNLKKSYKGRQAVKGTTFNVHQGKCWGCLDLMVLGKVPQSIY